MAIGAHDRRYDDLVIGVTGVTTLLASIRKRTVVRQAGWSVVGQAASSVSNLLLMIVVARVATAVHFGVFALVLMFYVFAVRGQRSVVSTPLLMSVAGATANRVSQEIRGSIGASLLVGLGLGIPGALLGIILGGLAGELLVVLSLFIPVLLVQDGVRFAFIAQGKAAWSAACDVSWLVLQSTFSLGLVLTHVNDVVIHTIAWGSAGALAGTGGLLLLRILPSPRAGRHFLNRHRRLLPDLASDFATASMVDQLAPYVVAIVVGVAAAGALRAGLVLLGVVSVVIMGITPLAQLEATKLHMSAPKRDHLFVVAWAGIVGALSVLYGVVLIVLPDAIGRELLGDTWALTSTLLLPLALCLVARSPYSAIVISLRARLQLRTALRLRLLTAPSLPLLAAVGGAAWGVRGAAWGFAAAAAATSCYAVWILLRVSSRQREAESSEVEREFAARVASGRPASLLVDRGSP